MKRVISLVGSCVVALIFCCGLKAQQAGTSAAAASAVVPQLVNHFGVAVDAEGKEISGIVGVTFAIYSEQSNGVPLWMETQNVFTDSKGNYSVQLGAASTNGLPLDLFTSSGSRWLGVRVNNEVEQPRVLLLSVPYALKAADAQTLGGLPASAFALAGTTSSSNSAPSSMANSSASTSGSAPQSAPPAGTVTGSGTTDFIPLWTSASTLGNSSLFQLGTGATAKLGIGTNQPGSTLDVKGNATIRGLFALPATGVAKASAGANSQPQTLAASAFSSTSSAAVTQTFEWQAEPVGNDTASPSGSLNLLYGQGTATPSETGLNISSKGLITFAKGQAFPGTGSGTVSSVGSGAGLTGGPITSTGTLSIASAGVTNAMLQKSSLTVTASSPLTGGGSVSLGGTTSLGLKSCSSNQVLQYVNGVWTCSNAGTGTITSVTAGSGLTGGGTGGSVTLSLDTTKVPELAAANIFTQTQVVSVGSATATALEGETQSETGTGILGISGIAGSGVFGQAGIGVYGNSTDPGGNGIEGWGAFGPGTEKASGGGFFQGGSAEDYGGDGIVAQSGCGGLLCGTAGYFVGDVVITGNLFKGGGAFKIDHPLDPANKYLVHSFVESPDMMNIYNGNATLDERGEAVVLLPDWFQALNRDFRYQLTSLGAPGPNLYIAQEISGNQFKIAGGKPGGKVSWQVTGVRHDAWANAHRIPLEEEKPARERGYYLAPELFGAPKEKQIQWARNPKMMERIAKERASHANKPDVSPAIAP